MRTIGALPDAQARSAATSRPPKVAALPVPEHPTREAPLPALRQDLQIMRGRAQANGAPQWLVFDAARNTYVQVGAEAYELLSLYPSAATLSALIARMRTTHNRVISRADADAFLHFLHVNALTVTPPDGSWRQLHAQKTRQQRNLGHHILHTYLYVRIPLVRPDRFLRATLPVVAPLMTRTAAVIAAVAGILGAYLISRQWDAFAATFLHFFSWQGFAFYAVSLVVTKTMHELGHAYAAHRFGCRVPTMGVAFLVMFPVLYTDTTDVWRLADRRQRLLISAAGIIVELGLAAAASLAWVFLPDGPWRSLAFTTATASVVLTLAVNLNPFMRFDGYYLLADAIGVENLQSRSFAVGRWRMREILFQPGMPNPEPQLPERLRSWLIVYAWATWVYRLILFIGIALLVYVLFFKALGVILFAVEIIWFIGRPVADELKMWWQLRERIMATRRTFFTGAIIALLAALAVVPWSTRIAIPSIVEPAHLHRIYAPQPSRIVSIDAAPGDSVVEGQTLARLEAPQLAQDRRLLAEKLKRVDLRLRRIAADPRDRAQLGVLRREKAALESELAGVARAVQQLHVQSPISGRVAARAPNLHAGRWVGAVTQLFVVHHPTDAVVHGYVDRGDLGRFDTDARGIFIPDDLTRETIAVVVASVDMADAFALAYPELASLHGGAIATRAASNAQLIPTSSQYHVRLKPLGDVADLTTPARGVVVVEGRAESFAARASRQIMAVLVRESGL